MIIGRQEELRSLKEAYESKYSEFVAPAPHQPEQICQGDPEEV